MIKKKIERVIKLVLKNVKSVYRFGSTFTCIIRFKNAEANYNSKNNIYIFIFFFTCFSPITIFFNILMFIYHVYSYQYLKQEISLKKITSLFLQNSLHCYKPIYVVI